MLSLLTQRLAIYTYADVTPDAGYDNATYSFAMYAWGRIEPTKLGTDKTTAEAAIPHRTAKITVRDQISISFGSLVVDPSTGDQWRIQAATPRQMMRMTEYQADYAPQFNLTATVYGP